MLPVFPWPHPILYKGPGGGMARMGCQEVMGGMEPQGDREKKETLDYRDHREHRVCCLTYQDAYRY